MSEQQKRLSQEPLAPLNTPDERQTRFTNHAKETTMGNSPSDSPQKDPVKAAFAKAKVVVSSRNQEPFRANDAQNQNVRLNLAHKAETLVPHCPIIPLGSDSGAYYFIGPNSQLRKFSADALEAGRGVRALFAGISPAIDDWCISNFPAGDSEWSHKKAGLWIIEQCNAKGVYNPSNADLRSVGVWRDDHDKAVAHCGNKIVFADGASLNLTDYSADHTMIGARRISTPKFEQSSQGHASELLDTIQRLWGWKRDVDAAIWFGWLAAACLGGFPDWRAHIYVHGSRGSGKSKLIELAACLLGDMSGDVINDATEAGLRQSRNNQARPMLIDEFEPDENPRTASRQDGMMALFRRMSGGAGGRISRGGADHIAVSFRTLGGVYVTSINHVQMEAQDRSRFVVLELQTLPTGQDPTSAAEDLRRAFETCSAISRRFRGRLLTQSERWDRTHAAISAKARSLDADTRQAATAATILAGLDLALFDGDIDTQRMENLMEPMKALIADAGEADEGSEGRDVFDHLLSETLLLDHGVKRTVRELVIAEVNEAIVAGVDNVSGALGRYGIFVDRTKQCVALRTGKTTPTARLYANTKWRNGAHASALLKVEGVVRPTSGIRFSAHEQHRVLLVPFERLGLAQVSYK